MPVIEIYNSSGDLLVDFNLPLFSRFSGGIPLTLKVVSHYRSSQRDPHSPAEIKRDEDQCLRPFCCHYSYQLVADTFESTCMPIPAVCAETSEAR